MEIKQQTLSNLGLGHLTSQQNILLETITWFVTGKNKGGKNVASRHKSKEGYN